MKNALLVSLVLIYPVAVYFGLNYIEPAYIAVMFAVIFLLRHLQAVKKTSTIPHLNIVLISVLSLLGFSVFFNSALALKFYPVVMSLSFLVIFAFSLYKPPSVVEIIARLHDDLDDHGIAYTRRVTMVWCGFFVLNAGVACLTIFHENPEVWVLYNGLISYLLMGLLMAGEFAVRVVIKRRKTQGK